MDITKFSPKRPETGTFFCLSTSYTAVQTAYPVILATSGKSIFLTDIVLVAGSTAGSLTLTEAPTGTSINILDPVRVAANGVQNISLSVPLKASSGSSLRLTTVGFTDDYSVILNGYIL